MKIIFIILVFLFSIQAKAQERTYEIAAIGFYNLENLFDTDSSMHIINVKKLMNEDKDYVSAKKLDFKQFDRYSISENQNSSKALSNTYENIYLDLNKLSKNYDEISLNKDDHTISVNTEAIKLRVMKRKEINDDYNKDFSSKEFKRYISAEKKFLSKKEFKELAKKDTVVVVKEILIRAVNDEENTPKGKRQYTDKVYQDKLDKLASVISQLGKKYTENGVALLGLSEIENKSVLEDLLGNGSLKESGLEIEHYDCLYNRGVDVALFYNKNQFELIESHIVKLPYFNNLKKEKDRYFTRDILWVKGKLLSEKVHVFVNHWPSRYGGEAKSSPGRELGAQMCIDIIDSIKAIDPNAQFIVMGDLNDDPTNKSVKKILKAGKDGANGMYNPLFKDYKKGYGSLAYRGSWNLFDQVLLSSNFLEKEGTHWQIQDAEIIYNQDWINRFGGYEGGPNRSFGGNYYRGGYSDHLPSLVYLKKIPKQDKDNDGIVDEEDDCPEDAGIEVFNGCPDTDGDGIMDKEDLCLKAKGLAEFKGCPDTDGDGVEDSKDKCLNEKGSKENNGCPYKDTDNDGILDKDDKCPQTKGTKKNNGCPEIKEEVKQAVKAVFENLVFDTGKSTIRKSSSDELDALAKILNENPELLLTISGHTDNVGNDENNMALSKNRANAAKGRLVSLGVDADRIQVFYYGETKPIATNDTPEGRQTNRRVDFDITSK